MLLGLCNNTKENFLWEPEKMKLFQISQNYILLVKFLELYLCFHNSCEI